VSPLTENDNRRLVWVTGNVVCPLGYTNLPFATRSERPRWADSLSFANRRANGEVAPKATI
jgi:hypothetical protein